MENRVDTVGKCDAAIARHELLNHPFYQSWSAGTLPIAALRDYAREYGAFIATIDSGWRTLGENEVARHEIDHARVWDRTFAAALATSVEAPRTAEVGTLLETARECFASEASAIGALYAFEAQQPATAKSKLLGLKAHYAALPAATGEYFELHSGDYDEKALLVERMAKLDDVGSAEVVAACERMSRALYDALSGIHGPYAGHCAA